MTFLFCLLLLAALVGFFLAAAFTFRKHDKRLHDLEVITGYLMDEKIREVTK